VKSLTLVNRTPEKARDFISQVSIPRIENTRVNTLGTDDKAVAAHIEAADLLVNTTSVGMYPNTGESIWQDFSICKSSCRVVDIVYNPRPTKMLRLARAAGLETLDGIGMLVWQAALAWRIWFGFEGPVDLMREAALSYLSKQFGRGGP
jgi:shikimate dehydrogenase